MADEPISALPLASTPLDGSEIIEILQAGNNTQVTTQDLATLAGASLPFFFAYAAVDLGSLPIVNVLSSRRVTSVVQNSTGHFTVLLDDAFTVFPAAVVTVHSDGQITFNVSGQSTGAGSSKVVVTFYNSSGSFVNPQGFTIHVSGE